MADQKAERDRDTEHRILQAARSVFVRRGTAGARMQEIAEEAGVNQALLHYYFRSKDRLAAAVFREAAGRLLPAVFRLLGSDLGLEDKVERFVHLYIDTVRQSPFMPGYIISELHHHPERLTELMADAAGMQPQAVAQGFLRRLQEQLDERATAGTMRRIASEQFLLNLLGLAVFPFIARPLLQRVIGMDDPAFEHMLDERRRELPAFILNALRP
jgi:TetR/AcrR family transcriptional regulator